MTRPFLYQTVGYAADNENPTEAHINESLVKALQMPAASRNHTRVWLPHRETGDVCADFWEWMDINTHAATSRNLITNCGHIAVWVMVPEDDAESQSEWGPDYEDKFFHGGFFTGVDGTGLDHFRSNPSILNDFFRNYAMGIAISAMKYAQNLQDLGYDVGFLSAPFMAPQAFNNSFSQYFDEGLVVPIIMVYAGTKGSVIRHSYHRNKVDIASVANTAVIKMDITSAQYYSDLDGNQAGIKATIDGIEMFVPLDPANRHYAEILRQVDAGTLTIADAD